MGWIARLCMVLAVLVLFITGAASFAEPGRVRVIFTGDKRVWSDTEEVSFRIEADSARFLSVCDYNGQVAQRIGVEPGKPVDVALRFVVGNITIPADDGGKFPPLGEAQKWSSRGIYWILDEDGKAVDSFAVIGPVPRPIDPDNSRLGVHHAIFYGWPERYEQIASLYEKAGAWWLRCMTTWAWGEDAGKPAEYDFSKRDAWYDVMKRHGLKMLSCQEYAPEKYMPPYEHLDEHRRYLKAYCEHYKGEMKYYEVWNEANGWPLQGYRDVAKMVYETVKSVDPKAVVVQTGIASGIVLPDNLEHMWGLQMMGQYWQDEVIRYGLNRYTDVYNIHFYPYQWKAEEILGEYQKVYKKHGIRKPLWVTENGQAADVTNPDDQRSQAEYLVKTAVTCFASGVTRYFWFLAHDHPQFAYGLLGPAFQPKASYAAYSVLAENLQESEYLGRITSVNGLMAYRFDSCIVLWADAKTVRVRPSRDLGVRTRHIEKQDIMGRRWIRDSREAIDVGRSPIYVSEYVGAWGR